MPAAGWIVPAWDIPLVRIVSVHEVEPHARVGFSESSSSPVVANAVHAQAVRDPTADGAWRPRPAVLTWAMRVWIVGAGVGLLVLFAGLVRLSRLAAKAEPLHSVRWRAAADAIALEYGLQRPVRLLASKERTLLGHVGISPPDRAGARVRRARGRWNVSRWCSVTSSPTSSVATGSC